MSMRVLSREEARARDKAVFDSLQKGSFFTSQTVSTGTQLYLVVERIDEGYVNLSCYMYLAGEMCVQLLSRPSFPPFWKPTFTRLETIALI